RPGGTVARDLVRELGRRHDRLSADRRERCDPELLVVAVGADVLRLPGVQRQDGRGRGELARYGLPIGPRARGCLAGATTRLAGTVVPPRHAVQYRLGRNAGPGDHAGRPP